MTKDDVLIKRINDLCSEKKITLNRLATLSGISHSTLENIIKGRSRNAGWKTIYYIAQGFDMSLSEFFEFPEMYGEMDDD